MGIHSLSNIEYTHRKMFAFQSDNDFFVPMQSNFGPRNCGPRSYHPTMRPDPRFGLRGSNNFNPRNRNPANHRQKRSPQFEIPMVKNIKKDSIKTKITDGQIFISFSTSDKLQHFNLKSEHTFTKKLPKYIFEDKMEKDVKLEFKGGKLILTIPEKKVVKPESKVINIPITFEDKDVEIEILEEKSDQGNSLENDDVVMVEVDLD